MHVDIDILILLDIAQPHMDEEAVVSYQWRDKGAESTMRKARHRFDP